MQPIAVCDNGCQGVTGDARTRSSLSSPASLQSRPVDLLPCQLWPVVTQTKQLPSVCPSTHCLVAPLTIPLVAPYRPATSLSTPPPPHIPLPPPTTRPSPAQDLLASPRLSEGKSLEANRETQPQVAAPVTVSPCLNIHLRHQHPTSARLHFTPSTPLPPSRAQPTSLRYNKFTYFDSSAPPFCRLHGPHSLTSLAPFQYLSDG